MRISDWSSDVCSSDLQHGIAPILIAAPNTPEETLRRIADFGGGYTYCVARTGVTGTETGMTLNHGALFESLARHAAPPPVLGFGISAPAHVRAALKAGDRKSTRLNSSH